MLVKTRRGDTMIEVMFGVAIFGLLAITTIALMNSNLAASEVNLEETMARNEMNAQAEAIRFIHSSYASTNGKAYRQTWEQMTNRADEMGADAVINISGGTECAEINSLGNSFAIRTDSIQDGNSIIDDLHLAETYPHVGSDSAAGIWVNIVPGQLHDPNNNNKPYYYDFYIRSCWYGIGSNTPTTLDTVIRLYNPDRRTL